MFDFENVEEQSFSVVPAGIYPCYVDGAEFKESQAGARYLSIKFKIFGEKCDGRIIFNNYNLFHAKEQVKNIAMSQLLSMLMASGFEKSKIKANSEEDLLNLIANCRCMIKVGTKVSQGYGEQNTIKGYQEIDETIGGVGGSSEISASDIPF